MECALIVTDRENLINFTQMGFYLEKTQIYIICKDHFTKILLLLEENERIGDNYKEYPYVVRVCRHRSRRRETTLCGIYRYTFFRYCP